MEFDCPKQIYFRIFISSCLFIFQSNFRYQIIAFPMSHEIKPIGKNCEIIIKELGIQDYALGKSKVFRNLVFLFQHQKFFNVEEDEQQLYLSSSFFQLSFDPAPKLINPLEIYWLSNFESFHQKKITFQLILLTFKKSSIFQRIKRKIE